jgi:hypothetical protein
MNDENASHWSSQMAFLGTEWAINEIAALHCPPVQVNPS